MTLKGDCDIIDEKKLVKEKVIDLGEIPYNEEGKDHFKIKNKGKVPYKYIVSQEKVSRPGMFIIESQSGIVNANDKVKIEFRMKPGIPAKIEETLLVYCAHFPTKKITVTAVGTFPFLMFSTVRDEREVFQKKVEAVEGQEHKAVLMPKTDIQRLLASRKDVNRSQLSTTIKPHTAELEAEVDSQELCNTLLMQYHAGLDIKTHSQDKATKVKIVVAKYTYNFGNIVTSNKVLTIPFYNIGKANTSLSMKSKKYKDIIKIDRD